MYEDTKEMVYSGGEMKAHHRPARLMMRLQEKALRLCESLQGLWVHTDGTYSNNGPSPSTSFHRSRLGTSASRHTAQPLH